MGLTLTARSLDRWQRKQLVGGGGLGGDPLGSSSVPDVAGSSVGDMLQAYLQEMEAAELRGMRVSNVWIGRAIGYLKEHIAYAERSVGPIDPAEPYDEGAVEEITQLLEHPNPQLDNNSFGALFGAAYEDVLALNRGCVQRLNYRDGPRAGTPGVLKVVDGARVTLVEEWDGTGPRYRVDMGRDAKPALLDNDELVMIDASPTSYSDRGIAPMHLLKRFLMAELATFKRMHLEQVQASPGGVFILPGANAGTPDALQEEYEANIQGNAGIVFMNVPAESRYIEIGTPNLEQHGTFQFYEILVRGIVTAFGIPPMILGWYADVNRSYGEVAHDLSEEGVANGLRILQQYINTEIVSAWGPRAQNIQFTFDQLVVEQQAEEAASLRTKAGPKDFATTAELRVAGGYEEIPRDQMPDGAQIFLHELFVPTPVGNAVIDLPWTLFFKFTGIDPQTLEMAADNPLLPQPKGGNDRLGPGASVQAQEQPSPTGRPGELPPPELARIEKRLRTVRNRLSGRKGLDPEDPDDAAALAELAQINDLLMQYYEGYVPEDEDEEHDDQFGQPVAAEQPGAHSTAAPV